MSVETEQIKERLDIAEVVGEYVALKPAGQYHKGLCPFHQEKSPSFMVSPSKGIWHCFGCFPPGEKIKTPFGYHEIQTLDEKHYVVSGKADIQKIQAKLERDYDGDLIFIRLRKLPYRVRLTADHKVFVVRGAPSTKSYKVFARRFREYLKYRERGDVSKYEKRRDKYFPLQKISAGDIKKGDLLLYPIDEKVEDVDYVDLEQYLDKKSRLGPQPPKLNWKVKIDDKFLKLIGYYIAEGSNHRAYIRFSLGNHEEAFAQEILDLAKKIFGLKGAIHRRHGSQKTGLEVTICHAHLATIFANFLGKGSANKHIPFILQRLPSAKQMVLLRAIHKGDGTSFIGSKSTHKHLSVTSISRILAEQMADILLRCSLFPTVSISPSYDKLGVHHREAYTVIWSEEVSSRYNLVYYYGGVKYWLLPISQLERSAYRGPVYNLTVDQDHSYVTESFMVANCGEGGDVISFIQKIEGLDFPAALKMLAERAGVTLHAAPQMRATGDRRTRLYEILKLAANFYHEILMRQPAGAKALAYLKERGLTSDTMNIFTVGYSLKNWDVLFQYLKRKGYQEADIIATGLAGKSQRGKAYDRFRGRIMFPIEDVQGRVIAFGGRITPWHEQGNEGKYINSPETEIYEKRKVVYNLNHAKRVLRRHEPCLVVEGYMDIAMLVQAGVENVVATSGTAFTADHIQLLKRYTNTLHFAFDGDAAGLHAAQSATQAALAAGMRVATILFPGGQDPADVVLREPDQLPKYLSEPTPLVNVLLSQFKASDKATDREELLRNLLPFIASVSNLVQQGEMVQAVAATLHVPENTVYQELSRVPRGQAVRPIAPDQSSGDSVNNLSAERLLIGLVLAEPAARMAVFPHLKPELLTTADGLLLFDELSRAAHFDNFQTMPADELLSLMSEHVLPLAEACRRLAEEVQIHSTRAPKEEAVLLFKAIQRQYLKTRLQTLQRQISENGSNDRNTLLEEFKRMAHDLAAIEIDG